MLRSREEEEADQAERVRLAAVGRACKSIVWLDKQGGRSARSQNPGFSYCGRPATHIAWHTILSREGDSAWRCRRCWYREYLKTSRWESVRERALQRAGHACRRCGERAGRSAKGNRTGLQVHHLNYDHVGFERDEDLVVLCFACHRTEHGLAE